MLAKCLPLQILAKFPLAKCPLAKCPLAKCPGFVNVCGVVVFYPEFCVVCLVL